MSNLQVHKIREHLVGTTEEHSKSHSLHGSSLKRWTCCGSESQNQEGCYTEFHKEDTKSTSILSTFEDHANTLILSGQSTTISNGPIETINNSTKISNKLTHSFLRSSSGSYTLVGVALKFKEKPETIKTINNIQNDSEIYSRLFLYIPWEADKPFFDQADALKKEEEGKKKNMITKLMRQLKITEDEAQCYLVDHDYDFEKAIKAFQEDIEWENSQPIRHINNWGKK